MINHVPGHSSVHGNQLTVDKGISIVTQKFHHAGNILRFANSSGRMLIPVGVRKGFRHACSPILADVNPSRGYRIHAHLSAQTYRQGVRQCGNASLGGGIAFRIGLGLKSTG